MKTKQLIIRKLVIALFMMSVLACGTLSNMLDKPTKAPDNNVTGNGNPIQGKVYGINILGVETSEREMIGMENNSPQYLEPTPNHIILYIKVDFYKDGELLIGKEMEKEPYELTLIDSSSNVYHPYHLFNEILDEEIMNFHTAKVYFDIPQNINNLELRYRDLDLISLDY